MPGKHVRFSPALEEVHVLPPLHPDSILNPALVYVPTPVLSYNVTLPPTYATQSGKPLADSVLLDTAVYPALTRLRIISRQLPHSWAVDVISAPDSFVTVSRVLDTLYSELRRNATEADFAAQPVGAQQLITAAYLRRCRTGGPKQAEQELAKGLKQVDFLGERIQWCGLVETDILGVWEVQFR